MNTAAPTSATEGASGAAGAGGDAEPDSFWRSLVHLNNFRLFLGMALAAAGFASEHVYQRLEYPSLFMLGCGAYFLAALLFQRPLIRRSDPFERQVVRQALVDIACLGVILYLTGGNSSGIGLLLIVTLAAVGMLRDTRQVLFWAALASIVVLAEQSLQWWRYDLGVTGFVRAGLLSMGFFAVALLSHALAKGTRAAAALAQEKTRQARSLERINERMIQELPYAVMAVGGDGEVLQYNARIEALLGGPLLAGCALRRCAPGLAELWNAWCRGDKPPLHPLDLGQDGRRLRPRFIELEPTRSEGALIVLEDVTELEARAQRMKLASLGMLTANLAHEIRNPLSAIRHAAGLLREDAGDGMTAKLTRIIEDNTRRLNALVEDVLALNRRDRVRREVVDVAGFLASFIQQFTQREGVAPGIITLDAHEDLSICMDVGHLEQILWNLLRNAWRYCTRGADAIRVRAAARGANVEIEVFNDGPSMSREVRAHLFEPFYTTEKQGSGLGLYIARELAEANDAYLRCPEYADGTGFVLRCQVPPC